jgi:hypothetical protein
VETGAEKIQWHPGFYGAAELELIQNKDVLEFEREYNLSKEPLRVDLLIVKKARGRKDRERDWAHIQALQCAGIQKPRRRAEHR